jgi:hypothetical protein
LVKKTRNKTFYPKLYKAYWHAQFYKAKHNISEVNYFAAIPNRGAGIGHQLANWIAGYWFAKQFNLKFAHIPFSSQKWEDFFGFGENEIQVTDLVTKLGYSTIKLPLFDEYNPNEVSLIKKIIRSYNNKRVVFIAEQDQFYKDQFGVMNDIKSKFYASKTRKNDKLIYNPDHCNIAVHLRRGDIVSKKDKNPNLSMRWQNNDYFFNVLSSVMNTIKSIKPTSIYIFSQGLPADFKEFTTFDNMHFSLEMNEQDSFLHMVYADILITSKSSFSYKPALLNNGLKICPRNFWHGYPPNTKDWILAEEDGSLDVDQLKTRF